MTIYDGEPYRDWRRSRINKMVSVLSRQWFKGKNILEVATGLGHVSKILHKEYKANMFMTEGRGGHLKEIAKNNPDCQAFLLDHNTDWSIEQLLESNNNQKFDLIIHWGLMYHLDKWERDFRKILSMADLVCLETEVSDSNSDNFCTYFVEGWESGHLKHLDEHKDYTGSRPSAAYVERVMKEEGFEFVRYDDEDLNAHYHHYDWVEKNDGTHAPGRRRYWICRKSNKGRENE